MKKIKVIAEIAQAHDGSLGIAHSYIDALKGTGVDIVKFQTHVAEAESSLQEPFRVKFSYKDKTRYEYWKRMEFSLEEWIGLKKHCEDAGMEFMSSPFSLYAVELLEKIGVNKYKIGSGEVTNLLLLEKIASTGKEVYLSSGMSDFGEIEKAITLLQKHNIKTSIFQCTTAYPTKPEDWGLHMIDELKKKFNLPVGFSDHSGDIYAPLSAAALGAELIEFHVVFDKKMFGPDATSSLELKQVAQLLNGIKQLEDSFNAQYSKSVEGKQELKMIFEKSLAINKALKAGDVIKLDDLETKKPRDCGINARDFKKVIGRRLKNDKAQWEFLNFTDLENE